MTGLPLDDLPDLSPRQRQILDLLRTGKVNKEIANELGIGLGTVKQHIVAIFRKLKVRNRAAAVSCDLQRAHADADLAPLAGSLLERRPCVVLSLLLAPSTAVTVNHDLMRVLHQALAAYAFDHDAVFLARHQCAGDLIFGIRGACIQDVYRAVLAARLVYRAVAGYDPDLAQGLRGGIAAGLAVISINRRGAWSGEAMASAAIADARDLAAGATAGALRFTPAARNILTVLGPVPVGPFYDHLHFATVDHLAWQETDAGFPGATLFGREKEMTALASWLAEGLHHRSGLLCLEGEIGMGKSTLCRWLAREGELRGWRLRHFFVLHDLEGPCLRALPEGLPVDLAAVCDEPAALPDAGPELLLVDDADLLPPAALQRLIASCRQRPCRLLLAGRRFSGGLCSPDAVLRLGRLARDSIAALMHAVLPPGAAQEPPLRFPWLALAELACGVPLFARELSRTPAVHIEAELPLSLRLAIAARLDPLGLDRLLLRHIARFEAEAAACLPGPELARKIGVSPESLSLSVEQAVGAGVLRRSERGGLAFAHPLLRQAILQSEIS
ncbi:MAG: LuxR C-terminal-related transcriptional regulator [Azonexus sp.]|nr:LuxR C-terminal-related transcriptional regulator [Azonexus sp.]MCK6413629.1 LuxR C-terminal-related transcriptional regulator [Azonexus sp.]